jgi:thiamine kinase-like enzyme
LRSGPASWIQVDAHLDNVLWRPGGDAVLVDWSQAAIGPPAVDLTRVLVEGVATPGTAAPLVSRYLDELGRGTAPELREAMALALTPLVQGGVAWAGREDLERDGRPAALCENMLRGVLEWFDAAAA